MSRRPPPVRRARPRGRRLGALVAAIVLITAVACSDDDGGKPEAADGATERPTRGSITVDAEERTPAGALPELTAVRLDEVGGARILVDSTGRQVLLNGASYNALADLPTAHAALPPNRAPTADDWDAMAALGFDVVRLEVSWSALEPERGRYDDAYLASIRDAVDEAAARRLYVVVAMHQEAWGPAVASPPDTVCPEGTQAVALTLWWYFAFNDNFPFEFTFVGFPFVQFPLTFHTFSFLRLSLALFRFSFLRLTTIAT